MNVTHDHVKVAVWDACPAAGFRAKMEVPHLFGPFPTEPTGSARGSERRMDVVAWDRDLRFLVDVTRRDGATATHLDRADALAHPLRGVLDGDKEKLDYYADHPHGWTVLPFSVDTQCAFSPCARQFMGILAQRTARRNNGGEPPKGFEVARVRRHIERTVGCALMRGQANQILSFVDGSPHAALARAGAFTQARTRAGRAPRLTCVCSSATCVCGALRAPQPLPAAQPAAAGAPPGA